MNDTAKVDWKHLDQQILDAMKNMQAAGYAEPTIRSVYYILSTANIIPGTKSGYKSLDAKIVQMRQDGSAPWGYFAIKRGRSISASTYYTPENWASFWIHRLKDAPASYRLPRWFGQEHLVEVWVEKDGLLGATANWVRDLDVTVRAPQGQGAWEFIHDAMRSIQKELEVQNKTRVHILYLGDLDPSGARIPFVLEQKGIRFFEEHFGMDHVDFKPIALFPKQVQDNNLPDMPESAETLAKIRRDPNMKWYRERYPEIFTELDAFYALATKEAQRTIRDAVEGFFDDKDYRKSRKLELDGRSRVQDILDEQVEFKED